MLEWSPRVRGIPNPTYTRPDRQWVMRADPDGGSPWGQPRPIATGPRAVFAG